MPTLILPCLAIFAFRKLLSPAIAARRGDPVVPPRGQRGVLAGAEGGGGSAVLRVGVGHQQTLRRDLDRGDAVVQGAEMAQGAIFLDGQRLALEVLVLEHLTRRLARRRCSEPCTRAKQCGSSHAPGLPYRPTRAF